MATIEWQAAQLSPGLRWDDLATKLAEGLVGISMNDVVQKIDGYYEGQPR